MSNLVSAHIRQLVLSLPEQSRSDFYAAIQQSSSWFAVAHLPCADRLASLYASGMLSERDRAQLLVILYEFR
jgi:hypothetical protein